MLRKSHVIFVSAAALSLLAAQPALAEVGKYGNKFIFTTTGKAFVPNYWMLGGHNHKSNLSNLTQSSLNSLLDEAFDRHGFNGLHVPVYGKWFHIGDDVVKSTDKIPDPRTFDKLEMIIKTVRARGGATHIWLWGDSDRKQTSRQLAGGIMGAEERAVLDMIASRLGPLKGWTMGYGYDLWEWVSSSQLKAWRDYMKSKGVKQLLSARSGKNSISQIYNGMDIVSFEMHKPDYNKLVQMITYDTSRSTFSEDRYRVVPRPQSKDYSFDETRRGMWIHTLAGGVAAIWGYLDSSGNSLFYPNKDQLSTYSKFWKHRFLKDMVRDNSKTNGYALRNGTSHYVFYKEGTNSVQYGFDGASKPVVAVDTKKPYAEIPLGVKTAGSHTYTAPYSSDWAIAVGEFAGATSSSPSASKPTAPTSATIEVQ